MTESPYRMLPVAEALATVLAQADPLPVESAPLIQALGRILAVDVTAPDPLPPFAASVKDGYAVVAADGPGEYPVIGEVTAGRMADFTVFPGNVAYITTGAPLPVGADAVIILVSPTRSRTGTSPRPSVACCAARRSSRFPRRPSGRSSAASSRRRCSSPASGSSRPGSRPTATRFASPSSRPPCGPCSRRDGDDRVERDPDPRPPRPVLGLGVVPRGVVSRSSPTWRCQ